MTDKPLADVLAAWTGYKLWEGRDPKDWKEPARVAWSEIRTKLQADSAEKYILELMLDLGIAQVQIRYDGSEDSGNFEDPEYTPNEGVTLSDTSFEISLLSELLEYRFCEALPSGIEINDGGCGTMTVRLSDNYVEVEPPFSFDIEQRHMETTPREPEGECIDGEAAKAFIAKLKKKRREAAKAKEAREAKKQREQEATIARVHKTRAVQKHVKEQASPDETPRKTRAIRKGK